MKRAGLIVLLIAALAVAIVWWLLRPSEVPSSTAGVSPRLAGPPPPVATPGDPEPMRAPAFSKAELKEIADEGRRERFTEKRYEPPYALPVLPKKPSDGWHSSPEALLASATSATAAADFDWWFSLWDEQARKEKLAMLASGGHDRSVFVDGWKREYAGRRQVLVRRIDLPGFAIVYLRREDAADDSPEAKTPLAMKADAAGRWWLTHDLTDNPVYFYDSMREDAEIRTIRD